ncbi:epithelial splicing regulatory protein 1-like isoform X1 [Camellia sinensis]|uniref:epithelial splicing regulatory protein 1-like isoform X1 n=1 Tax=Camellia sinensis TaxID=4442 RepID=UPI0010357CFB|nr:epithelial splicing regulatory protein 1-like isoform X1 [Camellia sinensis]
MFYRGRYGDVGDGREMGSKRQRVIDQSSSFYGTSPGSSFMYNPPPYSYIGQPPPFPVVRLRGLPFDCSETDIAEFFQGFDIVDVLFVHKNGKFTGEAYCVLSYPLQVDFALQRNRQNIGRRYVEVFRSTRQEYYKAIANEVSDSRGGSPHRSAPRAKSSDDAKESAEHTGVLRLRGLPFSAGKDDISDFFKDYVLSEDSIQIAANSEGRATGEAFVEFASAEDSKAAMAKDRMTLGNRYIELFPSSHEELDAAASRGRLNVSSKPKSFDEGKDADEWTGVLRMRGLPFSASKDDILDFFKDFMLLEDAIHLISNPEGRPTGEAFVDFASAEASKAAMAKDRKTLGSRYIELFPSSAEELNEAVSRGR